MPALPLPVPPPFFTLSPLFSLDCRLLAVGPQPSSRLTPVLATLTEDLQITENKATLSPFPATLTSRVKPKSFVCHSYEKHRGGGGVPSAIDPQIPPAAFNFQPLPPVTSHQSPVTSHEPTHL